MNTYAQNILTAAAVFPFAALLFTLPFAAVQYHKYGSLPPLRVAVVYSFMLYLITVYFMVILPLPSFEEAAAMTGPTMQLAPLQFARDFFRESGFMANDFSTYLPSLKSSQFLVVVFNILMFFPLGVYLNYYYERKWYQTLLLALTFSMFLELTQLTALYGIYPRPYRLFDVDDLILNTLGAMAGHGATHFLTSLLPSRERLDEIAYERGKRVSLTRRLTAFAIDAVINLAVIIALYYLVPLERYISDGWLCFGIRYAFSVIVYFVALPALTKGFTLGKKAVSIRLLGKDKKPPSIWRLAVRYFTLYFAVLPSPLYFLLIASTSFKFFTVIFSLVPIAVAVVFVYRFFATGVSKKNKFAYERLSGLENVSVIKEVFEPEKELTA